MLTETQQKLGAGQNGKIRSRSEQLALPFVKAIHWANPNITANNITDAGFWLVGAGTVISEIENIRPTKHHERNKVIAFGFLLAGIICDGLDGPYARFTETDGPEGGAYDAKRDKQQEALSSLVRGVSAFIQRQDLKAGLHIAAGITDPQPAYYKNQAELNGYVVKEDGGNWLSQLGTRKFRVVEMLTTVLPQKYQTPATEIAAAMSFVGNLAAVRERIDPCQNGEFIVDSNKRVGLQETARVKDLPLEQVAQQAAAGGLLLGLGMIVASSLRKKYFAG